MPNIKSLHRRLEKNPDDIKTVLNLCAALAEKGEPISLDLQEKSIRHYLSLDPGRHDLSFRLAKILMETSRPVPLDLEERSLRHAIATEPGRLDLLNRFAGVALDNVLSTDSPAIAEPIEYNKRILDCARSNLYAANETAKRANLPSFGVRWCEYAERMRRSIDAFKTTTEALHFAQTKVGFEHRLPAGQSAQHYHLYIRELETEFPEFSNKIGLFDDFSRSAPETVFNLAGRKVSNLTPYIAHVIMACFRAVPAPRIIIELGGGYGAPARSWLNNPISPISTYVLIDIPVSLFFAEACLAAEFGSDAVHYINDAVRPEVLTQHKIFLCPIHMIEALAHVPADLIINTGSLQEMTEDWVSFYMAWLDRQNARYFYSQNYFGQPVNHLAESMNLWSGRPSPAWKAKSLRVNSPFIRMQANRNYLEAIYEKLPSQISEDQAEQRLGILSERDMTLESLCEYMDLFRRSQAREVASTVLARAMNEMPAPPKEALYLAQWLKERYGLSAVEDDWLTELQEARASGVEGTT